jgi:hypothetical protein
VQFFFKRHGPAAAASNPSLVLVWSGWAPRCPCLLGRVGCGAPCVPAEVSQWCGEGVWLRCCPGDVPSGCHGGFLAEILLDSLPMSAATASSGVMLLRSLKVSLKKHSSLDLAVGSGVGVHSCVATRVDWVGPLCSGGSWVKAMFGR